MDDAAATTAATGRAILDGAVAGGPGAPLGASGDAKRSAGRHAMAGRAGNRGTSPAEDHAADPPGSGAPPRLPFPPAVLRMMARYWNSRLAELDGAIAAETRPDRRAAFAFERLCVQGILAGLDERPGAS